MNILTIFRKLCVLLYLINTVIIDKVRGPSISVSRASIKPALTYILRFVILRNQPKFSDNLEQSFLESSPIVRKHLWLSKRKSCLFCMGTIYMRKLAVHTAQNGSYLSQLTVLKHCALKI